MNAFTHTSAINGSNRNYGIDLLRLVSMFYIVVLHSLGQGGVLNGDAPNLAAYFMENWAYCAVDCFGLISGYVGFRENDDQRYNFYRYISLYFQVVFYGLLITLLFQLFTSVHIGIHQYVKSFFPVATGAYWYFSAYTGLFFVVPLLNAGVRNFSKQFARKSFFVLLFCFSVLATVYSFHQERFCLEDGYSFVWLCILYILGALMKKGCIGTQLKNWIIVISVFILVAITTFSYIIKIKELVNYISPTILISAVFHVILFSRLCMGKTATKIVKLAAPGAFTVMLINNHPLVWNNYMENRFAFLQEHSVVVLVGTIIGFSLLFVIGSVTIDFFRQRLFNCFRFSKLARLIDQKINNCLDRL